MTLITVAHVKGSEFRRDLVAVYANSIRQELMPTLGIVTTDWAAVNGAIIKKWSVSGLNWIKREAWKVVEHGAAEPGAQ